MKTLAYSHHSMKSLVPFSLAILFPIMTCQNLAQDQSHIAGVGNPRITKLADNVMAVTGLYHTGGDPGVNAGIIFTSKSIIFIDAGMSVPSAEFIMKTALEQMPGKNNLYLILTHHHSDHIFGMKVFKDKGASVIAHDNLRWFLENRGKNYKQMLMQRLGWDEKKGNEIFGNVTLSSPDCVFDKDTVLAIDGEAINLLYTPGHAPSEISVYHPKSKTLFAGDAVYEGMNPTTHFGDAEAWQEWIRHLERMKKLDIKAICPGHGNLCTVDELNRNIKYLRDLLAQKGKDN